MKVQVMSRKLIKPCKPTPNNLRNFKISYLDEIPQPMNFSVILYYPSSGVVDEKLNHLEESLAEILPRFYPLAGRYIKENHLVNCSDQGAEYVEAQVDCTLLEHINGFKVNHDDDLNDLLPCEIYAADEITDPLLAIQVSKFQCGGLAICVSISHRIFNGASMETFIDAWTSACRGDNTETICPVFNSPLLFPSRNIVSRDWSKFRFYQVDFGWGKPIWASIANPSTKNFILLMDNKGSDGIEAWIHLDKEDMHYFEQDEEINLFTT